MIYSSHDMLALVGDVMTRRIAMVCGKAAKRAHLPLAIFLNNAPERAKEGVKAAKKLHDRYRKGDYRHRETELGRFVQLCQWLHEINGSTRIPAIDQAQMTTKIPCQPGIYPALIQEVRAKL